MTYDELKRAVIASSTYLTSDVQRRGKAVAFQSKIDNKVSTGLGSSQCAYCLMQKHGWCECHSCLIGETPAERLLGMGSARKLPPPPSNTRSKGKRDGRGAFTAMKVAIEDKSCEETYMFTSTSSDARYRFCATRERMSTCPPGCRISRTYIELIGAVRLGTKDSCRRWQWGRSNCVCALGERRRRHR